MKQLRKIKLINWHMFTNETIDVKGHTLITGENASGKSTIMDAIQFVLTVGKVQFNKAANEKGKRTLNSYVHGKIGAENNPYLRNNAVVSYIALEFHDDTNNIAQTIGVCLESESPQSKRPKEKFFKIDEALDDTHFLQDNTPRKYNEFKTHLKNNHIIIEDHKLKTGTRNIFGITMGVKKTYFDMVPRALAFKPLDNLNEFVYNYILEENEVEIDSLRSAIRSYQQIQSTLKIEKEKREYLKQIIKEYNEYIENVRYEGVILNVQKFHEFDKLNNQIKQNNTILNKYNQELTQLESSLNTLESKENEIRNELNELEYQLKNNPDYDRLLTIEANISKLENELLKNKTSYQLFYNDYHKFIKLNKNLNKNVKSHKSLEDANAANLYLENYRQDTSNKRDKKMLEINTLENKVYNLNNTFTTLIKEKESLENNIITYSKHISQLKDLLSEELSKMNNQQVTVDIFSDLLEIEDPKWRNAIEGYLNTQRFNLIVEPRYYHQALRIYEQVKDTIYGVGIVDTSKLTKYNTYNENSLANKVSAKNKNGELYKNYLLGNVICVDTVEELNKHKRAITTSCMLYSSYVVRAINPSIYRTPYIGKDAIEKQIANIKLQIKDITTTLNDKEEKLSSVKTKKEIYDQILNLPLNVNLNKYFDYLNIESELKSKKSKAQELKQDTTAPYFKLIEAKDDVNKKLKNILNTIRENQTKKGEFKNKLEFTQITQENLNKDKLSLEKELHNLEEKDKASYITSQNIYKKDYKNAQTNFQVVLTNINHKINQHKQNTLTRMTNFEDTYTAGLGTSLDSIKNYQKRYDKIKDLEIRKIHDELEESKIKSEEAFKSDFMNVLRQNIESAKRDIKDLNDNLRNRSFAGEKYRFIINKSKDDVFGDYYDIITSNQDFEATDLFTSTLDDVNRKIMLELFDKIALFQDSERNERELKKYVDYRNYMHYDIEIKKDNGEISYYSKIFAEKSGGETQIPFYITIASSFEQAIDAHYKEDSACVVLFDEAFNNMDESRIKAMMEYYNNLNIQIILAVPPNRLETISNYVETTVAVARKNNQVLTMSGIA